jgi:hypothetical protein
MGRIYLIFLGFATGMVLALSGATFILGKLKEDDTVIGGEGPSFKANLRSGSPGLILAFFGLLLMMSTIFSRVDIDVRDQALYLGAGPGSAGMDTFSSPNNKDAIPSPKDILQSKVNRPWPLNRRGASQMTRATVGTFVIRLLVGCGGCCMLRISIPSKWVSPGTR